MNGLKCVRKICNLSAEDVADILGVSRQAVSSWENGKTIPEDRLKQLSEYFGISEKYFAEIAEDDRKILLNTAMVREDFKGKEAYRYRKEGDVRTWDELCLQYGDHVPVDALDLLPNWEKYAFTDGDISLEDEYLTAKKEKQEILKRIDRIIQDTNSPYESLRIDQTYTIRKGCRRYGLISDLLEHQKQIRGQLNYLFGLEIESVWKAMLLAYGLIDKSELYYREAHEWSEENGAWIEELSEILKDHWKREVQAQKNREREWE